MSCCDSRDDRVLRVFPEEDSGSSYINTAYNLLQNVVNGKQVPTENTALSQVRERVVWTKIERWTPCKECISFAKLSESTIQKQPFFLITIALENSLQLWLLYSHGACDLVCSLGGEEIRVFQHLSCPKKGCRKRSGPLAIKVSANVGLEVASLLNLRSFDEFEKIQLPKCILSVLNNENYIVLAVPEEIFVYANDDNFNKLFSISSCYYEPSLHSNPIALGSQWLAFADARLVHRYECGGGVCMDVNSQLSYTSVLISGAQSLAKGLISITGSITAALTRSPSNSPGMNANNASPDLVGDHGLSIQSGTPPSASFLPATNVEQNGHYMSLLPQQAVKNPGVVTIINCTQFAVSRAKSNREAASGLVAHFPAHTGAPLAFLQFSPNGSLLASADTNGREFNVFRILAHSSSVSLAAVHHLYSLHRGDTTASVIEMAFSHDSRWLIVGTHRGTAHVFPITPYGGAITRRTHCRKNVPNRFSRYHQSAGLDTLQPPGMVGNTNGRYLGQNQTMIGSPRSNPSPLGMGFPSSSSPKMSHMSMPGNGVLPMGPNSAPQSFPAASYPSRLNARLPPYPHPVTVRAMFQIKQAISIPGLDLVNTPTSSLPASGQANVSTSLPSSSSGTMASLSVAVNNIIPIGITASISMAFSPSAIYRSAPQIISAAASLNSLTGSGLSSSLGGLPKSNAPSPASTSLCMVTWLGDLAEYKLSPRVAMGIPLDKLSQDSPIELDCELVARWPLVSHLQAAGSVGGVPGPLYSHSDASTVCPCGIVFGRSSPCGDATHAARPSKAAPNIAVKEASEAMSPDAWISQVETFTCNSPARRIWSGPQFTVQSITPDELASLSPRASVSVSSIITAESSSNIPSRASLSTSPNVCQSEDSAFGDQERTNSPPTSSSSSASGSMTTIPAVIPLEASLVPINEPDSDRVATCPMDIQPQISKSQAKKNKKKNKCGANNAALNKDAVAVLEAFSGSADTAIADGNVETDLLAQAVQDFQF